MTRPELSGERLREVRDTCEGDILYPEGEISVRCAETTLALLDYVGELEGICRDIVEVSERYEPDGLRCLIRKLRSALPQPPVADG